MKQKMKNDNKIISSLFFALFLCVVFGLMVMNNQKSQEEILGANINNAPVIEKVLLNKTKYAPGDEMLITIEAKKANSINAFIENEKGYQKVSLFSEDTNQEKQIWEGTWIVKNSLDMKKYNLKTIAYNNFGTYEKMSFWVDPNPGHDLSSIAIDTDLDMNSYNITNIGSIQSGEIVAQAIKAIDSTGYFILPEHTTVERDTLAARTGMAIFNTDSSRVEIYDGTTWGLYGDGLDFPDSTHTRTDCTDAGGVIGIDSVMGREYCQFSGNTCPGGWTQAEDWASQTGICAASGDICGNHKTTCPTGWTNPPGDCTARAGSGSFSLIACLCGCRTNRWHNPGFPRGNHRVSGGIATSLIPYGSCGIDAIGCK